MDQLCETTPTRKILFLGDDTDMFERYRSDVQKLGDVEIVCETGSLSGINGRAKQLTEEHDVIVFQTSGAENDIAELKRLKDGTQDSVFVALVDDDVSIAQARDLIAAGAAEIMPSPKGDRAPFLIPSDDFVPDRAQQSDTQIHRGAVLSVAQSRGGAGGTTVAVNLSIALAEFAQTNRNSGEPNQVALLDFDLQFGNAGVYFDLEDNGGMIDLISSTVSPTTTDVVHAAQASTYGVDVLTAPSIFTPITALTADRARDLVKTFAARYSYVVIDLPKVVVDWIEPVIEETDRLVMVSDLSVPCIRQAKRLIDLYRESNITLAVDLVLNRERKTLLKNDAQRDAESFLDLKVAGWIPESSREERRSVDLGTPSSGRRSKGRAAFRRLGASLAKSCTSHHSTPTGR